MGESVSLAAMTETPIVVVVAQRPGPATGLPTRTEQGDLELVLHAGHGEFPRAIFAPATIEECFYFIRKALEIAEKSRSPVFVLTDQFLADSYRDVEPFPVEELGQVATCVEISGEDEPYRTYRLTESGVSPRLIPGLTVQCSRVYSSEQLVVADSDEHTEAGHITEDLSVRKAMVEKRMRKLEVIKKELIYPAVSGDDPAELVLVSWGSTRGAVLEAAALLRAEGKTVATVQLFQVWPLPLEHLLEMFTRATEVVCVEGNATGQLARLIRRETGFMVTHSLVRYDGLPITPEFVLRGLTAESEE